MNQKNKKILGFICLILGFISNFIAIAVLLIPFITRNQNSTLTTIGLILYCFAFAFLFLGLIIIIKNRDNKK